MKNLGLRINKKALISIVGCALALAGAITVYLLIAGSGSDNPIDTMEANRKQTMESMMKSMEVLNEELANYRSMIGSSMDQKKAVFILFNTPEECETFIAEHGNDEAPDNAGIGIVPLMESDGQRDFYNIVGKTQLEAVFDTLGDGEYSKTPVEFSGMFCYLKRIGMSSPIESDEDLINYIRNEKAQAELQRIGGQ